MISEGEVGAVFTVVDEASPVLRAIAAQFNVLQASIDKLKVAFKEIKLPPGVAASINKMTAAMDKAVAAGGKLETSMGDIGVAADAGAFKAAAGFGRIDGAIATTQGKLAALKAELRATGGVGGIGGGGAPPGIRARALGHGGGGGGSFGLHERVGPIGVRSHEGEMIAGAVAGFTAWEALKASADLQQVQQNLLAGGASRDEIEKATRAAYGIGEKYGLTARDVLQSINEIRNPLNRGTTANEGVEAALSHMDTLASAANALKAQGGSNGGDTAKELYDLVKSAEFRNAIGDKDFDKSIKSMVAADVATGGIVTPRTFLQMSQMLKGALPGLSDDYLYKIMPELAQEFKGSSAGTAAASLYQQLIAGQMRTKEINLLADLGMVDPNKVQYNSIGMIKAANPGFYTDADTFRSDPMKSIANIIDAMNKHGITDTPAQRDMFSQLFGNRNAAQMAMTLGYQYQRLERGAQGIENTKDIGATSAELLANNPYTQWQKFTSAATNAGAALGGQLMPSATAALQNLTTTVNAASAVLRGQGDNKAWHDLIFGTDKAEGGWLDKVQDWIGNNPIARANKEIGSWVYDRFSKPPDSAFMGGSPASDSRNRPKGDVRRRRCRNQADRAKTRLKMATARRIRRAGYPSDHGSLIMCEAVSSVTCMKPSRP